MPRRRRPAKLLASLSAAAALSVVAYDRIPVVRGYELTDEEDEVCSAEPRPGEPQLPEDTRNRCCGHDDAFPTIDEVARVDTFERVSCKITREYFLQKYEIPRVPVMLVGCDEDWPARLRWTPERLATRFTNESSWRAKFDSGGDFDNDVEWSDILDAQADPDRFFYVFDNFEGPESRQLDQDFAQPKPTLGVNMYASDEELLMNFPRGFGQRRWWFFGRGESGTHPHCDPHETDAWLTTVRGHKWWVVYPQTLGRGREDTLECDDRCSLPNYEVRDWFASVGKYAEHEDFDGQHPFHVLQRPGETIYVPAGYAHAVYNFDDAVGVTSNWASPYNLEEVWKFVRKFSERVQKKFYDGLSPELQEEVQRLQETYPDGRQVPWLLEEEPDYD